MTGAPDPAPPRSNTLLTPPWRLNWWQPERPARGGALAALRGDRGLRLGQLGRDPERLRHQKLGEQLEARRIIEPGQHGGVLSQERGIAQGHGLLCEPDARAAG